MWKILPFMNLLPVLGSKRFCLKANIEGRKREGGKEDVREKKKMPVCN